MSPSQFFSELGKLLQLSLEEPKKIYREEDLTPSELDTFTDTVLLLAERMKGAK